MTAFELCRKLHLCGTYAKELTYNPIKRVKRSLQTMQLSELQKNGYNTSTRHVSNTPMSINHLTSTPLNVIGATYNTWTSIQKYHTRSTSLVQSNKSSKE